MASDEDQVRIGERFSAEKWNRALDRVRQITPSRGRGVRLRQTPHGTTIVYDGDRAFRSSKNFRPQVSRVGDRFEVRWEKGLIADREPTIEGEPISRELETGRKPALTVKPEDFNAEDEAFIYFLVTTDDAGAIASIEPVASATELGDSRKKAHRLALVLYKTGSFFRALHTDQAYVPATHRGNGGVTHFFSGRF